MLDFEPRVKEFLYPPVLDPEGTEARSTAIAEAMQPLRDWLTANRERSQILRLNEEDGVVTITYVLRVQSKVFPKADMNHDICVLVMDWWRSAGRPRVSRYEDRAEAFSLWFQDVPVPGNAPDYMLFHAFGSQSMK
jgi:hypothetical protein